jgi:hypothetical protein
MQKRGTYFSLSLLLFCTLSNTLGVIHTNTISTVHTYIDTAENPHDTLLVLDLDNNLIEPDTTDEFGSDQWFSALVADYQKQGLSMHEAIDTVLPLYFAVHTIINLKPLEPDTVTHLDAFQNRIMVMSLTARSPELSDRTHAQLKSIGIDFPRAQIAQENIMLSHTHKALYNGGILFAGNNDKGALFVSFLETIKFFPKKVIFVDDKEKNVISLESALKKSHPSIEFIGLRHSKLDERVNNFRLERTQASCSTFTQEHGSLIKHFKTMLKK